MSRLDAAEYGRKNGRLLRLTRVHSHVRGPSTPAPFLANAGLDAGRVAAEVAGRVDAAFVRAVKTHFPRGGDRS